MRERQTDAPPRAGSAVCASDRDWVSRDTEVDQEMDREAREFLNDLQESKKINRMIVGWRPE